MFIILVLNQLSLISHKSDFFTFELLIYQIDIDIEFYEYLPFYILSSELDVYSAS